MRQPRTYVIKKK